MSGRDLDRQVTDWFESAGADHVPEGLLDDVFIVTRTSRQRRGAIGRLTTAVVDWWRAPLTVRVVPQQVFYVLFVASCSLRPLSRSPASAPTGRFRRSDSPPTGASRSIGMEPS